MKKSSAYARRQNASVGELSKKYLELIRLQDYAGAYRHMLRVNMQFYLPDGF